MLGEAKAAAAPGALSTWLLTPRAGGLHSRGLHAEMDTVACSPVRQSARSPRWRKTSLPVCAWTLAGGRLSDRSTSGWSMSRASPTPTTPTTSQTPVNGWITHGHVGGSYKTTGNREEPKLGFWVGTHQSLGCSLETQKPKVLLWPNTRWSHCVGRHGPVWELGRDHEPHFSSCSVAHRDSATHPTALGSEGWAAATTAPAHPGTRQVTNPAAFWVSWQRAHPGGGN